MIFYVATSKLPAGIFYDFLVSAFFLVTDNRQYSENVEYLLSIAARAICDNKKIAGNMGNQIKQTIARIVMKADVAQFLARLLVNRVVMGLFQVACRTME